MATITVIRVRAESHFPDMLTSDALKHWAARCSPGKWHAGKWHAHNRDAHNRDAHNRDAGI